MIHSINKEFFNWMPDNKEKIKALSGQLAIEMDASHFDGRHFTDGNEYVWENCKQRTNGKVCKTAPAFEMSQAIIYCIENKIDYTLYRIG